MLKLLFNLVLLIYISINGFSNATQLEPKLIIQESMVSYKDLQQNNIERRIDSLDVYSLAPSAFKLKRGHMLSYELYKKFNNNLESFIEPITHIAKNTGLEKELIAAVIYVESGFKVDAVSSKGAAGLMQLMPETLEDLGVKNPFDINENIQAGSVYLKAQIKRFGSLKKALAAYNAGPANVLKYDAIPPFKETLAFVDKVLIQYQKYKEDGLFK